MNGELVRLVLGSPVSVATRRARPSLRRAGSVVDGTLRPRPAATVPFCTPFNAWCRRCTRGRRTRGPVRLHVLRAPPRHHFSVTVSSRMPAADFQRTRASSRTAQAFTGATSSTSRSGFISTRRARTGCSRTATTQLHEAEDHDIAIERSTTPQGARVDHDCRAHAGRQSSEIRARLDEVIGSFRFGATR